MYRKSLKNLINAKLKNDVAHVTYTGPKKLKDSNEFIFTRNMDGWTVYQGCELIVGDTSLDDCTQCVLDLIDLS